MKFLKVSVMRRQSSVWGGRAVGPEADSCQRRPHPRDRTGPAGLRPRRPAAGSERRRAIYEEGGQHPKAGWATPALCRWPPLRLQGQPVTLDLLVEIAARHIQCAL